MPGDDTALGVDPERMLNRRWFDELRRDWVGHGIIPAKMDALVVIPVVRIALPVPRQPNRVWGLLEATIEEQLGMHPPLDAAEHHLGKLTVEGRTDLSLDPRRVDDDARGRCGLASDDSGRGCEQRYREQRSRAHHSPRFTLLGASAGRVENEHRIGGLYFVVRGGGPDQASVLDPQSTVGRNRDSLATYARIRAGIDLYAVAGDCDLRCDRFAPREGERPASSSRRGGEDVKRWSRVGPTGGH